jgi:hypothetical protein
MSLIRLYPVCSLRAMAYHGRRERTGRLSDWSVSDRSYVVAYRRGGGRGRGMRRAQALFPAPGYRAPGNAGLGAATGAVALPIS